MEYLPLLIIPLATALLLTVICVIKLSEKKAKLTHLQIAQAQKERHSESFYFILLVTTGLSVAILAPWVGYYIASGAKLNLIDNFITQIFIISITVIVTIVHHKKRDYK